METLPRDCTVTEKVKENKIERIEKILENTRPFENDCTIIGRGYKGEELTISF